MVEAPPLPGSMLNTQPVASLPSVEVAVISRSCPKWNAQARVYELMSNFSDDQLADVYIWMAERPMKAVDPIRMATASFDALREDELPLFFEKLKSMMEPELWELLTE